MLRPLLLVLLALMLTAVPAMAATLTLTWTDTNATPSNETGTTVERAPATGTPLAPSGAFAQIATVAADVVSYADTTVAVNASYCYRVAAFNATGPSAYSNTACKTVPVPLNPPTNLQITP